MLVFVLQWFSLHWEILIKLSQFPLTFQQTHNRTFHSIAYDCSLADWDVLHDNLRDVSWEDIFKHGASAGRDFCQ